MKINFLLFFLFLIIHVFPLNAQRPNSSFNNPNNPNNPSEFGRRNISNDSLDNIVDSFLPPFEYKYYYLNDFTNIRINADTTLDNEYKESEPGRRKIFYDLNTGNAGSATVSSKFLYSPKAGFHSGYDQYDVYNLTLQNFKFYDSERTLADLKFAFILGSQNNFIVGADFGQKFKSGISLSLNYNRVSQLGNYAQQETQSTSFGLAMRYETLKQKLNFFIGILSNTNNEVHNGGIKDLSLITAANFKSNIPVFLNNAATRFDYKDIFFHTRYNLDGKPADQSVLAVGHHFLYRYGSNRFSDVDSDSTFYKKYWIENRGLRNSNNINILSNEFYLASKLSWTNAKISLVYDKIDVHQESESSTINDVSLKFNGIINLKSSLNINTNTVLGIGNNAGTFTIDGETEIKLGKWIYLNGSVSFFRSQVPWRNQMLRLNDRDFYELDFNKPFGSNISAGLKINPLKLQVNVGQSLITNYLYFDTLSQPTQLNELFSSNYISASHKIKLWKIGFENDILIQNFNKDILALPSQIIRSNLFIESWMFKKSILLRLGAEIRFLPKFETPVFNPVLGNYYRGNGVVKDDYIMGDIYILGQVASKFRIFVKWENAQAMFITKVNYLAQRSPQFDTYIKLGFRWILLD